MLEILNLVRNGKKSSFTGEEVQKLLANDGASNDQFGISVAISGDGSVVVVGAHFDDDKGSNSGSVYVFTKQSNGLYIQSQKLLASDGATNDYFGYSVVISGDSSVIVVGAYFDDDKGSSSGSAYVFTKQNNGSYIESQKLTASDGAMGDYFGISVAVNSVGSVIVVGAYWDGDKGEKSGSVYVFTKQSNGEYVQSQKLLASDGSKGDCFGISVTISSDGSAIVVGAYRDGDKGADSGSAYVFTKQLDGSYAQNQKLTAVDGAAQDYFGFSVGVSGDGGAIVVGAYFDDDKGSSSGSAYVFAKQLGGGYVQRQKLLASDGAADDYFGYSVAVCGDGSIIAIGAYQDDDNDADSGSVYVFTKQDNGEYVQSQKLLAPDGEASDRLGYSVDISSDSSAIAVSAYLDDDNGTYSGSTYVFK